VYCSKRSRAQAAASSLEDIEALRNAVSTAEQLKNVQQLFPPHILQQLMPSQLMQQYVSEQQKQVFFQQQRTVNA